MVERAVREAPARHIRALVLDVNSFGGLVSAGTEIRDAARLELVEHVKAGTLSVLVATTYPLEQAAEAHRELAAGHTHGKIVLIP